MIQVWIDHGVKIFRVDNPHTKPVEFWQWLIQDVAKDHPDVIWLAEAFTKPAMMHTLGKVGFQQSYTYYTWRNQKWELEEYCRELAGEAAAYMRPSFWPTTHDILTPYMQFGGPTAWKLRAALAALLVPTYGIYAGYELIEHVARPGAEEQIDNEKYQFRDRRWADYEPGGPKEGQLPRRLPHQAQRDPPRAPRAALAAQPGLPPRRRQQHHRLLQAPGAPRRRRRRRHRRGQPRPPQHPGVDRAPRHARAGLRLP